MSSTEAAAESCGCDVTVAVWTGRETLALRQALRLSMRRFAERLGIASATVWSWESKARRAVPGPALQSVLDDALKLSSPDDRVRFRQILAAGDSASHGRPDHEQ